MKYKIKKETKPTLPTYGKYKAVAVHSQTVSSDEILKEAAQNIPAGRITTFQEQQGIANRRKKSNYLEFQNKVCKFAAD